MTILIYGTDIFNILHINVYTVLVFFIGFLINSKLILYIIFMFMKNVTCWLPAMKKIIVVITISM